METALKSAEESVAAARWAEAEARFRAVLQAAEPPGIDAARGPRLARRARAGLGRALLGLKRTAEALQELRTATEDPPQEWESCYWRGCAEGSLGDLRAAETSFSEALRLAPARSSCLLQRARVRCRLGSVQGALEDYRGADRWRVLGESDRLALAQLYLVDRQYDPAAGVLSGLGGVERGTPKVALLLGWAEEKRGRPAQALEAYVRAARHGGGRIRAAALERLGALHLAAGREEDARQCWSRAGLLVSNNASLALKAGYVAGKQGRWADCVQSWSALGDRLPPPLRPTLAEARSRLAAGRNAGSSASGGELEAGPDADALARVVEGLERDLRSQEGDAHAAHRLACVAGFLASHLALKGLFEKADGLWSKAIAAWVLVLQDAAFWATWRTDVQRRYASTVTQAEVGDLRDSLRAELAEAMLASLHQRTAAVDPNTSRIIRSWHVAFEREYRAAADLAEAGRRVPASGKTRQLLCGPVMVSLLQQPLDWAGGILSRPQAGKDRPAMPGPAISAVEGGLSLRLRRAFSCLGTVQTLVDLALAEEALLALGDMACPRCRARRPAAAPAGAGVCERGCPEFERRNPSYAVLPDGGGVLQRDAAELAAEVHLLRAKDFLSLPLLEVDKAAAHWRQALDLTRGGPAAATCVQRLVAAALSRARGLAEAELDGGVRLLEAAMDLQPHPDLAGQLSELLTERGVRAAATKPPPWPEIVADLRRASGLNPHAPRPALNRCLALYYWALERQNSGDALGAFELLAECLPLAASGVEMGWDDTQLKEVLANSGEHLQFLVRQRLGVSVNLGEGATALRLLERVVQARPGDATLRQELEWLKQRRAAPPG